MRTKLHFAIVILNTILGFRPCMQFIEKDWTMLASAAKVHGELHTTLIIL